MNDVQGAMRDAIQFTADRIHNAQDWSDRYYADESGRTLMDQLIEKLCAAVGIAADDDEPVTEEWLWSVGFRESLGEYELTHRHDDIHVSSIVLHPKWGWRVGSGSENHQSLIKIANQPTTRGSVRRLAAALGIQLKGEQ